QRRSRTAACGASGNIVVLLFWWGVGQGWYAGPPVAAEELSPARCSSSATNGRTCSSRYCRSSTVSCVAGAALTAHSIRPRRWSTCLYTVAVSAGPGVLPGGIIRVMSSSLSSCSATTRGQRSEERRGAQERQSEVLESDR